MLFVEQVGVVGAIANGINIGRRSLLVVGFKITGHERDLFISIEFKAGFQMKVDHVVAKVNPGARCQDHVLAGSKGDNVGPDGGNSFF